MNDAEDETDPNMSYPLLSEEDQVAMQDITQRLRGIYAVPINDGEGLLNGGNTAVRKMPSSPIQKEAADLIDDLRGQILQLRDAARKWYLPDGSFIMLDSVEEVIKRRKEAAEILRYKVQREGIEP